SDPYYNHFPYTTLFRSHAECGVLAGQQGEALGSLCDNRGDPWCDAGENCIAQCCQPATVLSAQRGGVVPIPSHVNDAASAIGNRSEEHTSELQSLAYLV